MPEYLEVHRVAINELLGGGTRREAVTSLSTAQRCRHIPTQANREVALSRHGSGLGDLL